MRKFFFFFESSSSFVIANSFQQTTTTNIQEHFDHAKVEKEKEGLRNELSKMKKLLEDNSETIDSQNQELIKLTSMIQKMVRLTNVFYFFFVFFSQ